MVAPTYPSRVPLDFNRSLWEQVFVVAPLVVIGTCEENGNFDLAPKHMAMPLGWGHYFGFVCTPHHHTYQNIRRDRVFTVSFPLPEQILQASLAAAPRNDQAAKPSLQALPTIPAAVVKGVLLRDAYLGLECKLDRIIDDFEENSLITGYIVAAYADEAALRVSDRDDQDVIAHTPLLAYLAPGRYSPIQQSFSFPFHQGFQR